MLKLTHVSCVAASCTLFCVRGVWMLRGSALLNARWVKIVPHVIDAVLLASAIAMAVTIRQCPFAAPWITAKVLALIAYILLGTMALKRFLAAQVALGPRREHGGCGLARRQTCGMRVTASMRAVMLTVSTPEGASCVPQLSVRRVRQPGSV